MPGDDWQMFANLRALFGYMWAHPGKKLLFMGGEFGQRREWTHDGELEWWVSELPEHAGVKRLIGDLNRVYRRETALHQIDFSPEGFEWVDVGNGELSIIAFLRKSAGDGAPLLVVCNFTPVPRANFLMGVPSRGVWREIINTDARDYGGSGWGNLGASNPHPWDRMAALNRSPSICRHCRLSSCVGKLVASAKGKAPDKKAGSQTSLSDGTAMIADGRVRAVIDAVLPNVDGGRSPAKRIAGEAVAVEAHCFTDGHDKIRVVLRWGMKGSANADHEIDMQALANDVWTAEFTPSAPGRYQYTVMAWVDHFESWRRELERREDRGDILVAFQAGAALIDETAARANDSDAAILTAWSGQLIEFLKDSTTDIAAQKAVALDAARAAIVARYSDRSFAATQVLELVVDRKRAAFSSWYELFPRSAAAERGSHGTFKDVETRLPHLAEMGFDVLYFPPIHPIGRINRKGTNNSFDARRPMMSAVPGL